MNPFNQLIRFISGWRFAVMLISTVGFFALLMLSVLFVPKSAGAAAQFAEDFKVWCFGYDPATGQMEWGYVWMLLIQPFFLIGIVLVVWWTPLSEARAVSSVRFAPYIGASLAIAFGLGLGLVSLSDASGATDDVTSFPAERIRTAQTPLPFRLVNQEGDTIDLNELNDRVVVITGVYASCGYTCPLILAQTKRLLGKLSEEEKSRLTIIAITLDPEHDTQPVLAALTRAQRLESPLFNAVTGDPEYVNEVLDRYNFSRTRNPETGLIDHANLFLMIDKAGKIAYRFSIGEIQESWMEKALHLLINESV